MSEPQGISSRVMQRLRAQAEQQNVTIDTLIEKLLDEDARVSPQPVREADYRTFVDYLPSLVFAHRPGGEVIYVNQAMAANVGRPPSQIIGLNVFETIPEEVGKSIQARLVQLTPDNPLITHEFETDFPTGNTRWERWTERAFFDDGGNVLFYLSVGEEITERKREIDQLEKSELQLSTLMDNLPGLAYRCSNTRDWTMTFVSSGCLELTGYKPEALLNGAEITFDQLIIEEDRERTWKNVQEALAKGESYELEYRIRTADGEVKTLWERGAAASHSGSEIILEGFISDITARKNLEVSLSESQALYQSLVESLPMRIYRIDRNGGITFANRNLLESINMTVEEVIGKTAYDLHPDELASKYSSDDVRVLEHGETIRQVEPHIMTNTDELRYVEVIKTPVYGRDGTIVGLQGAYWDVTELQRLEENLRSSQALYASLVETLPMNVYRVDNEGRLIFANEHLLRNLGASSLDEVLGIQASDTYPKELAEKYRADDQRVIASGETLHLTETNISPSTGKASYVEVVKTPIYDDDNNIQGIQGVFWDVIERKMLEETLRKSEARYRGLVEDLPVMLCSWLPGGEITFVNQAYGRTFGKNPGEFVGTNFFDRLPKTKREEIQATVTSLSPQNPVHTTEHQQPNAQGELRWYRWTERALFDTAGTVTG